MNQPKSDEELLQVIFAQARQLSSGCVKVNGIRYLGHGRTAKRFLYERFVGAIPEGETLVASCGYPQCHNHEHLKPCLISWQPKSSAAPDGAVDTECRSGLTPGNIPYHERPRAPNAPRNSTWSIEFLEDDVGMWFAYGTWSADSQEIFWIERGYRRAREILGADRVRLSRHVSHEAYHPTGMSKGMARTFYAKWS